MSDYRMDIDGSIGLSDYSNIHDYLGVVDIDDNFTITLNNNGNTEINIINSILKNNCCNDNQIKQLNIVKIFIDKYNKKMELKK